MPALQCGFTFIELLVVVIGILAAIAIPAYQNYIVWVQMSEVISLANKYLGDINDTYCQIGACPTLTDLNLNTNVFGKYVESLDVIALVTGQICAVSLKMRTTGVSSEIQGKSLVMAMTSCTMDMGSVNWSCTSADIEQRYLPKACVGI